MNPLLQWEEMGRSVSRVWLTESDLSPPKRILLANDSLKADVYYQQASQGAAFLWRGDFQNAKQLLQAVQRRIEKQSRGKKAAPTGPTVAAFHRHRQAQAHRAQLLSRLLIQVEPDLRIDLPRAPDVRQALLEVIQGDPGGFVLSLKDLLGFIGAHEWRKKGVAVAALENRIHPHFGTFSPTRGEYLDLIAMAPLPEGATLAFDIGTGTGVIAAILAKRGLKRIIATDLDPRALACAAENVSRLGYGDRVVIECADLFPPGTADLVVCNPPWVPAKATSPIERAIYDDDGKMLKGFLRGVREHLTEKGEAWLVLSDLAEHLGLRAAGEVEALITTGGLEVIDVLAIKARHGKASDLSDPLVEARSKEATKLFRLKRI